MKFKNRTMVILGAIGVAIWLIVFSLGLLINSQVYRDVLNINFQLRAFILSIFTYTPINIGILCLVAAFTGGCASRVAIHNAAKTLGVEIPEEHSQRKASHLYMNENPFNSMLRGIVVYFAFLAGIYLTAQTPFFHQELNNTPQPDLKIAIATASGEYGKAAGFMSLLAFVVGYDPTVFSSFMSLSEKLKDPK